MCWSAQVSMNTFLLVCFAVVIGLVNAVIKPWLAAFVLLFGSMQLVEYLLWSHLGDRRANALFSKVGLAVILLEPLAAILLLNDAPASSRTAHLRNTFLLAWAVFLVAFYASPLFEELDFRTSVAPNGHLLWHWLMSHTLMFLAWAILFLVPIWLAGYRFAFVVAVISLAVSLWTYGTDRTWGSMWCWFAAAASLVIVLKSFLASGWCAGGAPQRGSTRG